MSYLTALRTALSGVLCALALSACADAGSAPPEAAAARPATDSVVAVDDAGRTVALVRPAGRVVSLVPSITESLFALGAGEQVVGRTDFDVLPEAAHLPSVGGGLDPSLETLLALRPELVVSWNAEKSPELLAQLERLGIPTFVVSTQDTADVFHNLQRIGRLVGRDSAARALSGRLRAELAEVRASVEGRPTPSVLYIVWHDPPMTAGPNTFISEVIGLAGGRSAFPDLKQDWPQISMEEIVHRQPDVVVLPVGETRAHSVQSLRDAPGWRELRAVREGRVVEVPADLMNRPGARLGEAARTMRDALHPPR